MSIKATAKDWEQAAEAYEKGSKGATTKPTGILLERMNALQPFAGARSFLDNGCGTGNVMSRLIQDYGADAGIEPLAGLIAADWAPAMIGQVNKTKQAAVEKDPASLWGRVDTRVLDAMDLGSIPDESQSHVAAAWVYLMTADPKKCIAESVRVLQPGGVLGVISWGEIQWLSIMKPISQIRPDLKPPSGRPEWQTPSGVRGELEAPAAFGEIAVQEVPVELPFETRELFVDILLAKMPPLVALTKDFSDEEKGRLRGLMLEEMARLCPEEPGALKGVAIVGVAQKGPGSA